MKLYNLNIIIFFLWFVSKFGHEDLTMYLNNYHKIEFINHSKSLQVVFRSDHQDIRFLAEIADIL
jgi:hypothetical protein